VKERVLGLAIYWGIWLILPVLVDGLTAVIQLALVALNRLKAWRFPVPPLTSPRGVSVIIPVYNGEETLGGCLKSLRAQHYPQELIEVIVVDNGSTDRTAEVFQEQQRHAFRGQMHWVSIAGRGKPYALNAGLHLASHPYVCSIDADTVVHPDALREMVRHFEVRPELGAATGAIEVLPVAPEGRDDRVAFLIAECEFQEYLAAFWLGRQGQTLNRSLFTLAGAFSFFRREVLFETMLYDKQTVSEDTKVTFDVRNRFGGHRLACIPQAIVYVAPTPSLAALYSQRVRWQRGEIEVAAVHRDMLRPDVWRLSDLSLGRMMLIDHTFLFPRLVWTWLFPALVFVGYSVELIVSASVIIYLFYVLTGVISMLAVYTIATPAIRTRLRHNWWVVGAMPIYRFLIFAFRLAGSIIALTEPAGWRVQAPWIEMAAAVRAVIDRARETLPTHRRDANGL